MTTPMTTINYSIRSSFQPLHTSDGRKAAQPSPNEVKFDQVVKALLEENHTHRDLKLRLHQIVVEEAQKLPPIKVVFGPDHGGFRFSKEFNAFLDSRSIRDYYSHRSDPALIQAISDFGRFICDKFPFILDEMRIVYRWKLDKLLAKIRKEFCRDVEEMEFNLDLVAEATSFIKQMCNTDGRWKKDCLGTFPNGERSIYDDEPEVSFMSFTEMHPDFWMAHYSVGPDESYRSQNITFKASFRFARVLLQGGEHARYRVASVGVQDAMIYERIGLFGATSSRLAIESIPALVDFSIDEYDGAESVNWR